MPKSTRSSIDPFNRTHFAGAIFLVCISTTAFAQNDTDVVEEESQFQSYQELILADKPVAYWNFETKAANATESQAWKAEEKGTPKYTSGGPTSKESPLMPADNRVLQLDGKSALVVQDPGDESVFDFTNGDTISVEAWVNCTKLGGGANVYIIGKGRTGNKDFAANNQNWAVRLREQGGSGALSFLFRDERNRGNDNADWHRWTSNSGVPVNSGWHHVAFTYTFGKPEMIKGWIDGYPSAGQWDYGKQTKVAPLVDNDEIRIGASGALISSNSFTGKMDELALYRSPLTDEQIEIRCPPKPAAREIANEEIPPGKVLVQIHESVPNVKNWKFRLPEANDLYTTNWLTFPEVPRKYNERGVQIDRSNPFVMRAHCLLDLPAGEHTFLLRSLNGVRLFANGQEVVQTPFHTISGTAHGLIRQVAQVKATEIRKLQTGENEKLATISTDGSPVRITMEMFVGGGSKRPETGEVSLSLQQSDGTFAVLSPNGTFPLTDHGWFSFLDEHRVFMTELNAERRLQVGLAENERWEQRHKTSREQLLAKQPKDYRRLDTEMIDALIETRLNTENLSPQPVIDDWAFLRRVTQDVIGTNPSPRQIREFFADKSPQRRASYIDRLLAHPGWADHWVGYWQDVLAENPNIVNPTLNNTGPFRWWIHESFYDNKPIDRFVTELVRMQGSTYYGGPGGFEMASQNDVPMAAKAHIIGTAFLGVQMKCARCHDAPFHDVGQQDLFSLAAMLGRKPQGVPKTSTINLSEEALKDLIVVVSLKPGQTAPVEWTFDELVSPDDVQHLLTENKDSREQLAALVTSSENERFRNVIVNRLWKRYLGRGLVEPVDDWEFADPSHPELLKQLSDELVLSGYDLQAISRLILNSKTYQREAVAAAPLNDTDWFSFSGPLRRHLSAEQIVDTMFASAGKQLQAGQMNIDVDGSRSYTTSLNLGRPHRAWMFTSSSNERDRPSLSLPLSENFLTLMKAFGWRTSRQDPLTERDDTVTVLQPAILANGVVARRFTRMSEDSMFTELALGSQPLETLIARVFERTLTRPPRQDELELFTELLQEGHDNRRIDVPPEQIKYFYPQTTLVSWSNHLDPEANQVKITQEGKVRQGDPPTIRLQTDWRERMEDMLWAIVNSPEFVVIP